MKKLDYFKIKNIEQFIKGELETEEQKEYERQIALSPELKEKVELIKKMPKDLFILEKNKLAQNVKSWMDAGTSNIPISSKSKGAPTTNIKIIISIAAVFILIVTLIWFFPSSKTLDMQAHTQIAQVYQDPIILRSVVDDNWGIAIENYTNRDFEKMIRQMELWIDSKSSTEEHLFYFALANLYTTNPSYDIALEYFSITEQKDQSTYKEEIAWYRALIFIKRKEHKEAKIELLKIKSSNRYGQKAKEFLSELE